jgi:hypothetical protein
MNYWIEYYSFGHTIGLYYECMKIKLQRVIRNMKIIDKYIIF